MPMRPRFHRTFVRNTGVPSASERPKTPAWYGIKYRIFGTEKVITDYATYQHLVDGGMISAVI